MKVDFAMEVFTREAKVEIYKYITKNASKLGLKDLTYEADYNDISLHIILTAYTIDWETEHEVQFQFPLAYGMNADYINIESVFLLGSVSERIKELEDIKKKIKEKEKELKNLKKLIEH